jgi:AcrR family transcriptional regulator
VTDGTPLRRDAERNRQRLLDAAARLVVERGHGVPLEDVAAAAGVGIGTLYRRFPDRDALVRALFERHVDAVAALAEAAVADDRHGDGVERFLTAVAEQQAGEGGLSQVLRSGPLGPELAGRAQERITPSIEVLLARAHAAGTIDRGIGPGDLVLVDLMVSGVQAAGPPDDGTWRRALTLALAGLRPGAAPAGDTPDDEAVRRLQGRPRPGLPSGSAGA